MQSVWDEPKFLHFPQSLRGCRSSWTMDHTSSSKALDTHGASLFESCPPHPRSTYPPGAQAHRLHSPATQTHTHTHTHTHSAPLPHCLGRMWDAAVLWLRATKWNERLLGLPSSSPEITRGVWPSGHFHCWPIPPYPIPVSAHWGQVPFQLNRISQDPGKPLA